MPPEYRDLTEEGLISHPPGSSEVQKPVLWKGPAVLNQSICLGPGREPQSLSSAGRGREASRCPVWVRPRGAPGTSCISRRVQLPGHTTLEGDGDVAFFWIKKAVEKSEPSCTAGVDAEWQGCPRNQSGSSSEVKCCVIT